MGRSYWFECSRCGYRATVSGGADRGHDVFVQTVACRECRKLYDAVVRLRIPSPPGAPGGKGGPPPRFEATLTRLPCKAGSGFRWLRFKLQCPVSPVHRVEAWNEPAKCPACGLLLEKNVLPYRLWD